MSKLLKKYGVYLALFAMVAFNIMLWLRHTLR